MPLVKLPGGVSLAYDEHGEGDKAPIVLLHGFLLSRWVYDPVVQELASGRRVVRIDLKGHGDSEKPEPDDYSVPRLATEIADACKALGIKYPIIVGQGISAQIALAMSIGHAGDVSPTGLVLLSPSLKAAPADSAFFKLARFLQGEVPTKGVNVPKSTMNVINRVMYSAEFSKREDLIVERSLQLFDLVPTEVKTRYLREMTTFDVESRLPGVSTRTLLIHGSEDGIIPIACSHEVRMRMKNARFREMPGTGHLITWERPIEFLAIVKSFADQDSRIGSY
ncbi:MAG: alpha/beta hydrolase [Planctomycetes bacterium]|nr:alpha/beta hydrolase [Planctomycetota bacterium]